MDYLIPNYLRLIMRRGQIQVNCVTVGAVHTKLINTMSATGLPEGSGPEVSEKELQRMLSLFKSKTLTGTGRAARRCGRGVSVVDAGSGTCVHSDGGIC